MSGNKPTSRLAYPAGLLILYLLAQLLLLAWSAFPAHTMRGDQPRESWAFLAGLLALFASWSWPLLRSAGAGWRQATLEAFMLAAAGAPAAATAAIWVDAAAWQIISPACYIVAWLIVGAVAITSRPIVRWAYGLAATLANFGLLGLGYLWRDFLLAEAAPFWRLCPMNHAGTLAEAGWPATLADQLAMLMPVLLLLVLAAIRLIGGGGKEISTPAMRSPSGRG